MVQNNSTKGVHECNNNFPKEFKIVAEFCYKVKLKEVSSMTKVYSPHWQQSALKPIFEKEILALYIKNINKE